MLHVEPGPAATFSDTNTMPGVGDVKARREWAPGRDDLWPVMALGTVTVLTYGYEVFNFNLTMDEPPFGNAGPKGRFALWMTHGRWVMAFASNLIPYDVVPGLSTGLGVILCVASLWFLSRRVLHMTPWVAAAVTAVGGTMPPLALHLSFMINAFGIGVGFVLVAVFGLLVMGETASPTSRWTIVGAGIAGGLAINTYDGLVFAVLTVSSAVVLARPNWHTLRRVAAAALASVLVGILLQVMAAIAFPANRGYTVGVLQPSALLADPLGRAVAGLARSLSAVLPSGAIYPKQSPWLVLLLLLLIARAIPKIWGGGTRAVGFLAILGVLASPVIAAFLAENLPFRSMMALPFTVMALVAIEPDIHAPKDRSRVDAFARAGFAGLMALTVLSNSAVTNSLFASSEASFRRDAYLAMRIDEERRRLVMEGDLDRDRQLVAVVTPRLSWPASSLNPPIENLSISLFSGESWRAVSFLQSQGVPVTHPNADQREMGRRELEDMPEYPQPGWVKIADELLLINLGTGQDSAGVTD